MEPGSPVPDDLAVRLARLEAQVAWLLQRVEGCPSSACDKLSMPVETLLWLARTLIGGLVSVDLTVSS